MSVHTNCEACEQCAPSEANLKTTSSDATTIALLGQPNSGKSTIFNALTGARQRVGNWPGKTVEQKVGTFTRNGKTFRIVDLPGSYSLSPQSPEEGVTRDYITSAEADLVIVVIDGSQLERSAYMLADFVGINCPALVVVNLMDVAESQGKTIDCDALAKKLGVDVVPLVASEPTSYEPFFAALDSAQTYKKLIDPASIARTARETLGGTGGTGASSDSADLSDSSASSGTGASSDSANLDTSNHSNGTFDEILSELPKSGIKACSPEWLAMQLVEQDETVSEMVKQNISPDAAARIEKVVNNIEGGIQKSASIRYKWVENLIDGAVSGAGEPEALSRFDRIATGSKASVLITLGMILLGFLLAFVPATPIMLLGSLFSALGIEVASAIVAAGAPDMLGSFLSGVVFNSLSFATMMVGYVFGINLVFGIYEDIGYMARISYVFDHIMGKFGLQGKSVMSFLMCFGCTMGGVSGSRVIDSWGQRMLTVAMSWAIPCGSTWGVVPVLAVAFFGWGAPLVIIGIFVVCILMMGLIGLLFRRRLVPDDERAGLVMELPPYHKPHIKNVAKGSVLKSWAMLKRAFKVVAIFALAIWALTYSSTGIEGSVLYAIGTAIEPALSIFGLTWETFTAWICALAIKESALGVLSALFAGTASVNQAIIGAATSSSVIADNLGAIMAASITAPQALAFIFAFTFNMPCAASVSATFGEVHSAKWTVICAVFYIATSLILACVIYHVALLFF